MTPYQLEKARWDDADFDRMGWHDATIWGIAPNSMEFEFMLDLDYIFQWVKPEEGETSFKFWVSPVTMLFKDVHELKIEVAPGYCDLEVADLYRENPRKTADGERSESQYRLECHTGEISLWATGFEMFVRRDPILLSGQSLTLEERGGISFDRGGEVPGRA